MIALEAEGGAEPRVRVCGGLSCALAGGAALRGALADAGVPVTTVPCLGWCDQAPAAMVGDNAIAPATAATVGAAAAAGLDAADLPAYRNLLTYTLQGGYRLLQSCLDGRRSPEALIAVLHDAGLRGLGGGGAATAAKWRQVKNLAGPRALVVAGAHATPGSFKDRAYLEHDPHHVLEGVLLAAWAVDAAEIHICLRSTFPQLHRMLAKEIEAVTHAGLGRDRTITLHPESVMEPLGCPTLVNAVETLYWVRDIVERGAEWWRSYGRRGSSGLRSFSVSGRVRDPGVKVAPAGITVRELIDEHCGGMADGHRFHAFMAGGVLPAALGDLPLDFGALEAHGASIGPAAVIVLSDRDASFEQSEAAAHETVQLFRT